MLNLVRTGILMAALAPSTEDRIARLEAMVNELSQAPESGPWS
jgi:hypothetical protein